MKLEKMNPSIVIKRELGKEEIITKGLAKSEIINKVVKRKRWKFQNWKFGQKLNFGSKIDFLANNPNIGQPSKFW